MKISLIKTRAPFNALFSISSGVLGAIKEHMETRGYDESHPIVLWDEAGVVVDGHTRLEAARQVGIEDVAVHCQSFADEGAALTYAIHNQRHRRNLTEAEILKCIEVVDARRDRGGDRRSEEAKSKGANAPIEKSAETTARIVGTSPDKVKRARAVLSDPEVAEEVRAGNATINKGAQKVRAKKAKTTKPNALTPTPEKPHANTPVQDKRQTVLLQSWTELRAWRNKYNDFHELSAIFEAIDTNFPIKVELLKQTEGAPLPGELEGASSDNTEGQAEKPESPDPGDKSNGVCNDIDTTDDPDLSPSERGDPEPKNQAAVVPVGSRNGGENLVQCGNCDNFSASSGAPAGRGHCSLGEKSWNGLSTQFAVNRVHCSAFVG